MGIKFSIVIRPHRQITERLRLIIKRFRPLLTSICYNLVGATERRLIKWQQVKLNE